MNFLVSGLNGYYGFNLFLFNQSYLLNPFTKNTILLIFFEYPADNDINYYPVDNIYSPG